MNPERTLDEALEIVAISGFNAPQPYGRIVADAYRSGELVNPLTMLEVIAHLLSKLDQQ